MRIPCLNSMFKIFAATALTLTLAGCVIAPEPPPGPPVAVYPCCAVYPEYPGYYGAYGDPGFVYAHGYYGQHYYGGGWRR